MLFCFNQGESQPSSTCTQRDLVCGFLVCEMGIVLQGEGEKTNKVSPCSSLSDYITVGLTKMCESWKRVLTLKSENSCQIEKNRCVLNVSRMSLCLFASCNSQHTVKGSLYSLGKGRCVFTC